MTYKNDVWDRDLPCDSDVVALTFCRLLDESYYGQNQTSAKNFRGHYVRFQD